MLFASNITTFGASPKGDLFFYKMGLTGFDSKMKWVVSMPDYEVTFRYQGTSKHNWRK